MNIKEKIKKTKEKLDKKLSRLSTNKCTVSILRTKYNDKYIGLPMYEAYIQDSNNDIIDDTTTGRYCDIDSVIDEIEGTVFLLTNGTSELTILGHNIIIQIDMDSLVNTTQDDIVMEINQSILDGNDSGSIELNQVFYDWEFEKPIEYKTIGLKYGDSSKDIIYFDVEKSTPIALLQKCIDVALRTKEDQIVNLMRMFYKKGILYRDFEPETFKL